MRSFDHPGTFCRDRSEAYNGSKADVWSAGILLYTLVSGLRPFQEREDDQETTIMLRATKDRHVEALFTRLERLKASPELINLLRGMLRSDANRRLSMLEVRPPEVPYCITLVIISCSWRPFSSVEHTVVYAWISRMHVYQQVQNCIAQAHTRLQLLHFFPDMIHAGHCVCMATSELARVGGCTCGILVISYTLNTWNTSRESP